VRDDEADEAKSPHLFIAIEPAAPCSPLGRRVFCCLASTSGEDMTSKPTPDVLAFRPAEYEPNLSG
ncbi:hypothetical protein ABTD78_21530, partial [Acinetobacter baumannii]